MPSLDAVQELLAGFPRIVDGEKIAPYPYQAIDAQRIASVRSILVGMQQGTGKTPTCSLGALRADMGNMIFCPSSVKFNWPDEIMRWRPDLVVTVALSKRHWQLPSPGEVIVSSYGLLPGDPCSGCKAVGRRACVHREDQPNPAPCTLPGCDHKPLMSDTGGEIGSPCGLAEPYVLLCDEVHYLQNQTLRRRRWDLLRDRVWAAGGFLLGLTGTVVSNDPKDTQSILEALLLFRAAFPGGSEEFDRVFDGWVGRQKGQRRAPQGAARKKLHKRMRRVSVSRLRTHVLSHLPPVQDRVIRVELSKQTLADVDDAIQKLLASRRAWADVAGGLVEDPNARQEVIASGKVTKAKLSPDEKRRRKGLFDDRVRFYYETKPWVTDDELTEAVNEIVNNRSVVPTIQEFSRVRAMLASAKVSTALEVVELQESKEDPMIVFSQHVDVLYRLFEGRDGWGLYTGRVSPKKRHVMWTTFQKGVSELRHGLGVSIMAGAEGINLARAGAMLFIDAHFNPAKNDQASARLQRPGAEIHDSITMYRLVANHALDRLLWRTLAEKGALHTAFEDDEASMSGLVA